MQHALVEAMEEMIPKGNRSPSVATDAPTWRPIQGNQASWQTNIFI